MMFANFRAECNLMFGLRTKIPKIGAAATKIIQESSYHALGEQKKSSSKIRNEKKKGYKDKESYTAAEIGDRKIKNHTIHWEWALNN